LQRDTLLAVSLFLWRPTLLFSGAQARVRKTIVRCADRARRDVTAAKLAPKVKDGTMLIFPACLQRFVDATASEEERISISFNIMFSSFAENLSKPLWGAAAAPNRAGAQSSLANGDRHRDSGEVR
jgi:hypothetical protein